jgi:CheY-like chemotaxis protein
MVEKKILFVDDEEAQRDVMKRVLVKLGYEVQIADSSESALQILKKEKFPLIITDLSMPGMDGARLCELIRKQNSKVIIYALSGYIETYNTDKLDDAGFDGYLSKPATYDVLKQAVEGAFDKVKRVSNRNSENSAA